MERNFKVQNVVLPVSKHQRPTNNNSCGQGKNHWKWGKWEGGGVTGYGSKVPRQI